MSIIITLLVILSLLNAIIPQPFSSFHEHVKSLYGREHQSEEKFNIETAKNFRPSFSGRLKALYRGGFDNALAEEFYVHFQKMAKENKITDEDKAILARFEGHYKHKEHEPHAHLLPNLFAAMGGYFIGSSFGPVGSVTGMLAAQKIHQKIPEVINGKTIKAEDRIRKMNEQLQTKAYDSRSTMRKMIDGFIKGIQNLYYGNKSIARVYRAIAWAKKQMKKNGGKLTEDEKKKFMRDTAAMNTLFYPITRNMFAFALGTFDSAVIFKLYGGTVHSMVVGAGVGAGYQEGWFRARRSRLRHLAAEFSKITTGNGIHEQSMLEQQIGFEKTYHMMNNFPVAREYIHNSMTKN